MKRILTLVMGMVMGTAALAQQTPTSWNATNTDNAVIPNYNYGGFADTMTVSGLTGGISNVTVSLDITGTGGYYNGDLYGYLAGPNAGFAVLLNRVGVSSGNAVGYSDNGFNITLDDNPSNLDIHSYQSDSYTITGGQLTGTWGSDGENINPQSSPSAFTGSGNATLLSFDNDNANGTWTLFLSDFSSEGQATIVNWSLDITAVPEPSTLCLATLGALSTLVMLRKKFRA